MAAQTPKTTGIKKRQAIDKTAQRMFLWVAAASVTVSLLLVCSQYFYQQFTYNAKVIAAKSEAASTLGKDIDNIEELKKNFAPLEAGTIPNVDAGKILSALPVKFDTSGFGSSLQQIFAPRNGVRLEAVEIQTGSEEAGSLTGGLTTASSADMQNPTPQPIVATVTISGSYEQIAGFVKNLEHSIRPIMVDNLEVTGTSTALRATFDLTTYYQPAKEFTVVKEELPR